MPKTKIEILEAEVRALRLQIQNPPKKKLYVHPMDIARANMDPRSSDYEIIPYVPIP